MGSPRGDRGLYSAPRRGGRPRYASEIRPSGVTHRATRWVVSLIAEHTVMQVPLEIALKNLAGSTAISFPLFLFTKCLNVAGRGTLYSTLHSAAPALRSAAAGRAAAATGGASCRHGRAHCGAAPCAAACHGRHRGDAPCRQAPRRPQQNAQHRRRLPGASARPGHTGRTAPSAPAAGPRQRAPESYPGAHGATYSAFCPKVPSA